MQVDRLCVLGIDPARSSGWAIFDGERLHDSGTAITNHDRVDAVEKWLLLAATKDLIRVVSAETFTPGMLSHTTMFGAGAAWGRWLERIEDTGYRPDHCVRYTPGQWRKIVGIRGRGREACKAEAVRMVHRMFGILADDDQAEAVLIGLASLRDAPSVVQALPGRVRKLLLPATREAQGKHG